MVKMKAILIAAGVAGAASMVPFTNAALAHPGDVHHWFEHERAMSDGGPMIVSEAETRRQVEGKFERARVAGKEMGTNRSMAKDCFEEELKRGEGYTPDSDCNRGTRRTDTQVGVRK